MSAVYSAMSAASQAVAETAQDVANVNTPGYRPEVGYFQSAATQPFEDFGTPLPWGVQYVVGPPSTRTGPLKPSPDPLHVALQSAQDYFAVQTPQGVAYTRSGEFHLDAQGNLLSVDGYPVLGQDGPLQNLGNRAVIGPDGSVSTVLPDGSTAAGPQAQLLITNFSGTTLERLSSQLFVAPAGAVGAPPQGGVIPRELEGSATDTFQSMSDLVELSRWSQSLQKAALVDDGTAQEAAQAARLQ